ncbi:MAG: outer membrane beta-barrel protein [Prevotella sp.]|nr:outer membrane beta-barrel protein [Prevotella sp.]
MKKIMLAALMIASAVSVNAGGLLTNTNQSIKFLRNPARDAVIDIDGVYSNPAGVVFMPEGFHLGFNWQMAVQTREVITTNPNYKLGVNNTSTSKEYKGKAFVPFLPSVQAAYNKGNWSYQFNFAVHGGGGRCEFADGLGSFENAVANIANSLSGLTGQINGGFNFLGQQLGAVGVQGIQNISPVTGYSFDQYMEGKQYYFGFTLGAAYKVNNNLSLYGGLRFLYGTATYKAKLENIKVRNAAGNLQGLNEYFGNVAGVVGNNGAVISNKISETVGAIMQGYGVSEQQAVQMAMTDPSFSALVSAGQQVQGIADGLTEKAGLLEQYADGVNLQSDQSAFGVAPIIGLDYKTDKFNFAIKYEFKVCMQMKNTSTVDKVSAIDAVNKFKDGTSVHEDSPSMLSVGAQWNVLPQARLNLGYHHFFDKNSKKYNDEQKLLDGDTNEFLGGVEYDVNKKLTASAGLQITRYGLSDKFMNDMSFVVNSWSYGLGVCYKVSDKVAVDVAYFKTKYSHYERTTPANPEAVPAATPETKDDFWRTNRVFGAGVTINF